MEGQPHSRDEQTEAQRGPSSSLNLVLSSLTQDPSVYSPVLHSSQDGLCRQPASRLLLGMVKADLFPCLAPLCHQALSPTWSLLLITSMACQAFSFRPLLEVIDKKTVSCLGWTRVSCTGQSGEAASLLPYSGAGRHQMLSPWHTAQVFPQLPTSGRASAFRVRRLCLTIAGVGYGAHHSQKTSCGGTGCGCTGTARTIPFSLQMRLAAGQWREFAGGTLTNSGQTRSRIESKASEIPGQTSTPHRSLTMRPSSPSPDTSHSDSWLP